MISASFSCSSASFTAALAALFGFLARSAQCRLIPRLDNGQQPEASGSTDRNRTSVFNHPRREPLFVNCFQTWVSDTLMAFSFHQAGTCWWLPVLDCGQPH